MYNIGINTFLFTSPFTNDSVNWFSKFSAWGFDAVEIAAEEPWNINAELVVNELQKNNLQCFSVCAAMGPDRDLRGNQQQQQTGLHYLKAAMDFMERIGAELLVGPLYSSVGRADFVTEDDYYEQQKTVVSHLKTLCQYGAQKKLKLAIEPLNRFETDFLNTCDQALDMLRLVREDNLYVHLDTFHMNIEEKDLGEAIRKAGPRLGLLHTCGSDRGTPGKDHTDWPGISRALREIDYQGPLVIESFTPEVKVIAKAASIWRNIESSGQEIAVDGVKFLRGI